MILQTGGIYLTRESVVIGPLREYPDPDLLFIANAAVGGHYQETGRLYDKAGRYSGGYSEFDVVEHLATVDDGWRLAPLGAECPCSPDVKVEVLFRDGMTSADYYAREREWGYHPDRPQPFDIIAYRVRQ